MNGRGALMAAALGSAPLLSGCPPKADYDILARLDARAASGSRGVYARVLTDHCEAFSTAIRSVQAVESDLSRSAELSVNMAEGAETPFVSIDADLPTRGSWVPGSRFFAVLVPGEEYPSAMVLLSTKSRQGNETVNLMMEGTLDGSLTFSGSAMLLDNEMTPVHSTTLQLNQCDRGIKIKAHNAMGTLVESSVDALVASEHF